ncbi:MarR family transcriptional regulator [uncultured Algibacter sp.]|uniref:MarR family winged helix-turn-helix transcriptional regulator n=1 Tax=uncultured Algibacter sp. TaxID=298659 RepID=UPI002636A680|nr:MarR family transcriptional regulator [uncultured Algibacter sp.]
MNKDINPKEPNNNIGYLLWQTTMLWQRQMNNVLSKVELTHTQFVILASLGWLLKKSNNVTQKEIAHFSKTDRMMVSKILRTLQKNELIDRKEHETDTRAKCVFLTEKGKNTLQKAFKVKVHANNEFFSNLPDQERFMNDLKHILTQQ